MRGLALLVLLRGCGGGDESCICLENPASLEFQPPLTTPGTYAVHLVHDGQASDCTVTVPLYEGSPACEFDVSTEDSGAFLGILLRQPWKRVQLTIELGGSRVATAEGTISYRKLSDCAPDCVEADPINVPTGR